MNQTTTINAAPRSRSNTLYMAQLALLSAIIIIMAFTPLGYLRTPALSITLLTVPVAVGAIILGPKAGAFCGGVFGMTSFIMAVTTGGFTGMLFQINPLGTLFTCLVPRILEGFFCGLIFLGLRRLGLKKASYLIASLSCPLLNTFFFMSSIVLIFYQSDYIQGFVTGFGASNPLMFVIAFVGVQGAIEAVACCFVASIITITLSTFMKRG
jgi:uncharacterized membrane protein